MTCWPASRCTRRASSSVFCGPQGEDTVASIRDRIKELRRVPGRDLRPSPRNWRTHPEPQRAALAGVLAEVGYADALLARELPDGALELIDGHLRALTTPDQLVPVLVLDVSEAEAATLLATLDPLAAMAGADALALDALLRDVQTGSAALAELLADVAEKAGVTTGDVAPSETPFADFDGNAVPDAFVAFKLGDYSGRVGTTGYDSFVAAYQRRQEHGDAVLLDDILRECLDV